MHDKNKPFGPTASLLALILLDLAVFAACTWAVVVLRYAFGGEFSPQLYLGLSWTLGLYLCIAASLGVYPGYLHTPPEELKLLSWATSLFFLIISSLTFLSRDAESYSRMIFLCAWLATLVALPAARMFVRGRFSDLFTWGYPCVFIGDGPEVGRILENVRRDYRRRLRPMAVVSLTGEPMSGVGDLPQLSFDELKGLAASQPQCHAVLVHSAELDEREPNLIERLSFHFRHVLLTSDKIDGLSLWVRGVDVGGGTFLKTYFKLLDPNRLRLKRLSDIVLCAMGSVMALPLTAAIALCIKLDSPGPVFFSQSRLGRGGREFRILKFRTMRSDAQAYLDEMLAKDPALAEEWARTQKLTNDPRITRVGNILRKTSLDELPQFFNVIAGSMSLVGPRPIVTAEIPRYGRGYEVYKRLRPGISGLWQVSGRNRTSYARRVELDVYYVRNWSIWMDIWVLVKTFQEVVQRGGM